MSIDDQVRTELRRIERENDVRVLLAVESGSRAWGFASPDSDYDVRFIYVHPRDWYLSVLEPRDVVEQMLPGDLDVSGWDLRKTLRLFAKCNLALNEWLGSPIIYCELPRFREQLLALMPAFFNPVAGIHHYRSMATRSFEDHYVDGRIGIKKLFYVLRPLLACRWIEARRSQPPTRFAELLDPDLVTADECAWIEKLLARKVDVQEKAPYELGEEHASRIRSELERFRMASSLMTAHPTAGRTTDLDAVLRMWAADHQPDWSAAS
jgi:uncharacterized protein